jgi:hypothetical protein
MNKKQIKTHNILIIFFALFIFGIIWYWASSINNFTEIFIPAVIILIANVFSHEYGSHRYEMITAIFGWTACIFLIVWGVLLIINDFLTVFHSAIYLLKDIQRISCQIFSLCLITSLSRDYEKILKPKSYFFENKLIIFYDSIKNKFKR